MRKSSEEFGHWQSRLAAKTVVLFVLFVSSPLPSRTWCGWRRTESCSYYPAHSGSLRTRSRDPWWDSHYPDQIPGPARHLHAHSLISCAHKQWLSITHLSFSIFFLEQTGNSHNAAKLKGIRGSSLYLVWALESCTGKPQTFSCFEVWM